MNRGRRHPLPPPCARYWMKAGTDRTRRHDVVVSTPESGSRAWGFHFARIATATYLRLLCIGPRWYQRASGNLAGVMERRWATGWTSAKWELRKGVAPDRRKSGPCWSGSTRRWCRAWRAREGHSEAGRRRLSLSMSWPPSTACRWRTKELPQLPEGDRCVS